MSSTTPPSTSTQYISGMFSLAQDIAHPVSYAFVGQYLGIDTQKIVSTLSELHSNLALNLNFPTINWNAFVTSSSNHAFKGQVTALWMLSSIFFNQMLKEPKAEETKGQKIREWLIIPSLCAISMKTADIFFFQNMLDPMLFVDITIQVAIVGGITKFFNTLTHWNGPAGRKEPIFPQLSFEPIKDFAEKMIVGTVGEAAFRAAGVENFLSIEFLNQQVDQFFHSLHKRFGAQAEDVIPVLEEGAETFISKNASATVIVEPEPSSYSPSLDETFPDSEKTFSIGNWTQYWQEQIVQSKFYQSFDQYKTHIGDHTFQYFKQNSDWLIAASSIATLTFLINRVAKRKIQKAPFRYPFALFLSTVSILGLKYAMGQNFFQSMKTTKLIDIGFRNLISNILYQSASFVVPKRTKVPSPPPFPPRSAAKSAPTTPAITPNQTPTQSPKKSKSAPATPSTSSSSKQNLKQEMVDPDILSLEE